MRHITFFGSARLGPNHPACMQAKALAYELAKSGCAIITGGGAGIMQAANEGAFMAKAPSIGINIQLPHEQKQNPFCSEVKSHTDLSLRRKELITRADAYVVCAGGYGTLDELFEVLTLVQTGFMDKKIVLLGTEFWQPFEAWNEQLVALKLIDSEPIYLLSDDIHEIMQYLGV